METDSTMPEWKNDTELFELIRSTLYTPVVGDILDQLGRYHQFLSPRAKGIRSEMKVVGRAMPVLHADVHGPQEKPFGRLTEALDQLQPGEIYVASGGLKRCAYWGEILTATAKARGATGAVIDGYHRDTPQVLQQDWPVFSWGSFAQDSSVRTVVADFRIPVEIEGVLINPGDLIFGDIDGVLVIPRALEVETITQALNKARGEKEVRAAIENGMTSTQAFEKFGIL